MRPPPPGAWRRAHLGAMLDERGAGSGWPRCAAGQLDGDVLRDAPAVHHGDAVRQVHRLGDVVRDEQHRGAARAAHVQQVVLQLFARDRVQRRERLVQQQQRRLQDQGARQRDAALLAARTAGAGNAARAPTRPSCASSCCALSISRCASGDAAARPAAARCRARDATPAAWATGTRSPAAGPGASSSAPRRRMLAFVGHAAARPPVSARWSCRSRCARPGNGTRPRRTSQSTSRTTGGQPGKVKPTSLQREEAHGGLLVRIRRAAVGRALGRLLDLDHAHQVQQVEAAVVMPAGFGRRHRADRRDARHAGAAQELGQSDTARPARRRGPRSAGRRGAARSARPRRRADPPRPPGCCGCRRWARVAAPRRHRRRPRRRRHRRSTRCRSPPACAVPPTGASRRRRPRPPVPARGAESAAAGWPVRSPGTARTRAARPGRRARRRTRAANSSPAARSARRRARPAAPSPAPRCASSAARPIRPKPNLWPYGRKRVVTGTCARICASASLPP